MYQVIFCSDLTNKYEVAEVIDRLVRSDSKVQYEDTEYGPVGWFSMPIIEPDVRMGFLLSGNFGFMFRHDADRVDDTLLTTFELFMAIVDDTGSSRLSYLTEHDDVSFRTIQVIQNWLYDAGHRPQPPTTNTCQKCGSTIPLLYDDAPNMDAGLTVQLTGGYGEFVDAIDGPHKFILCHDCGHGLADFLGIDVRGWHSHPEIGWHGLEVEV